MSNKHISIGCDHAGFEYKEAVITVVKELGFEVLDYGTMSSDSVDYPDFVHPVANAIEEGNAHQGIVICGSGNGVAMTANKHQGIRAALCWQENIARLAREHNDANVIAIPARFISKHQATNMVRIFLTTDFEGGRHDRRVQKIACS